MSLNVDPRTGGKKAFLLFANTEAPLRPRMDLALNCITAESSNSIPADEKSARVSSTRAKRAAKYNTRLFVN